MFGASTARAGYLPGIIPRYLPSFESRRPDRNENIYLFDLLIFFELLLLGGQV
jgi:hypothetical protein